MMVANAQVMPPDDEIWYTTSDGKKISTNDVFVEDIGFQILRVTSNEYSNGKGVIKLDKTCTFISSDMFWKKTTLTSVNLPKTVGRLESNSFVRCTSLKVIQLNGFAWFNTDPGCYGSLETLVVPAKYVKEYKESEVLIRYKNKIVSYEEMYGNAINELNEIKKQLFHIPDVAPLIDEAIKDIYAATNKEEVNRIRCLVLAKIEALEMIARSLKDSDMTQNDEQMLADYTSMIKQSTDSAAVVKIKDDALSWIRLPNTARQALSDIHVAMQGEHGNALINQIVADDIEKIKTFFDNEELVKTRREEAIKKLDVAVLVYKNSKTELLGTLATPQEGPYIEVIGQNGKVVKLYNPKNAILKEEK